MNDINCHHFHDRKLCLQFFEIAEFISVIFRRESRTLFSEIQFQIVCNICNNKVLESNPGNNIISTKIGIYWYIFFI